MLLVLFVVLSFKVRLPVPVMPALLVANLTDVVLPERLSNTAIDPSPAMVIVPGLNVAPPLTTVLPPRKVNS